MAVAPIGTEFSGTVAFNDKQVPLPDGKWILVGDGYETLPSVLGGSGDVVEDIVLFRVIDQTVSAFVIAQRNMFGVDKGWGVAPDCNRDDIHVAVTFDDADGHGFCGFINQVVTSSNDAKADGQALSWRQAVVYAQEHNLALTHTWLMAGFRLSDTTDMMDVRYNFHPSLAGQISAPPASWSDSEWSKASVSHPQSPAPDSWGASMKQWAGYAAFWRSSTPAPVSTRQAVIDDLANWLVAMRYPVELGFRNRAMGAGTLPLPWTAENGEPSADLIMRLRRLDALRDRHALSDKEYREQRGIIESEHGSTVSNRRWTAESLTTVKAVTNQITSNMAAFGADLWVTGNIATTLSLIGVHTFADFGQYWSTEWTWNTFGPRALEVTPDVKLMGAGVDGPDATAAPAEGPRGNKLIGNNSRAELTPRTSPASLEVRQ